MKKLIFLGLTALAFVACREDKPVVTAPSIVGKWIRFKYTSTSNGKLLSEEISTGCNAKSNTSFTADKKIYDEPWIEYQGQCKVDGAQTGTYDYNPTTKKLKINFTDEVEVDVTKLTDTELVLSYSEGKDSNNDGVNDISSLYFKK